MARQEWASRGRNGDAGSDSKAHPATAREAAALATSEGCRGLGLGCPLFSHMPNFFRTCQKDHQNPLVGTANLSLTTLGSTHGNLCRIAV